MQTINKLIKNTEKLNGLLIELYKTMLIEKARYIVKFEYKEAQQPPIYSLHDRETGAVKLDKLPRLKAWLRLRNIPETEISYINRSPSGNMTGKIKHEKDNS